MFSEFMSQCYHNLSYSYVFMYVFLTRLCSCHQLVIIVHVYETLHSTYLTCILVHSIVQIYLNYGVLYHRFRSTSSRASLVAQTFTSQTSSESSSFKDNMIILLHYYFSSSEIVMDMSHQLHSFQSVLEAFRL